METALFFFLNCKPNLIFDSVQPISHKKACREPALHGPLVWSLLHPVRMPPLGVKLHARSSRDLVWFKYDLMRFLPRFEVFLLFQVENVILSVSPSVTWMWTLWLCYKHFHYWDFLKLHFQRDAHEGTATFRRKLVGFCAAVFMETLCISSCCLTLMFVSYYRTEASELNL